MFKDDYKNSFKDISPKKSLQDKVKAKMYLELERKNSNIFSNKKLVYALSLALAMIIVVKIYTPKNFEDNQITQKSAEVGTEENEILDIQGYTENQIIEGDDIMRNSGLEIQVVDEYTDVILSEEEKNIEFSRVEANNENSSLALNFEGETEDVILTYEEYKDYIGVDFLPNYLPEGFEIETPLSEMKILNIFYKDGRLAYDPVLISYSDKRNIENSKFIDLIVSKIDYLPVSDLTTRYIGELKEEVINNQKVYLGYDILLGTKFNTKEEVEELNKNDEYSLYLAKFEKDGVYYNLTSSFLGKEEFLKVLKSLI